MFRESALALIRHHHPELAALKVKALGIYGSVARGEDNPDSDVDLLVEFDGEVDWKGELEVQRFLGDLLGRSVDLHRADQVLPRFKPYIKRELIGVRGFLMPHIPGDNPDGSFKYPPPSFNSKRDPMVYVESIAYYCERLRKIRDKHRESSQNNDDDSLILAYSFNVMKIGLWIPKVLDTFKRMDSSIEWDEIAGEAIKLEHEYRNIDADKLQSIVNVQIDKIYELMQKIISVNPLIVRES